MSDNKQLALQLSEHVGEKMPKHVGIIMDGNGRWAQAKGMPRVYGHKKGVDTVRATVAFARRLGIESLTLFAFSSENWKRPQEEVSGLMDLFMFVLTKEIKTLHKNNVRLKVIGELSAFSDSIQKKVADAHELTAGNDGLTLNIAANYGGRWDIVTAAKEMAHKVQQQQLALEQIDETMFDQHTQFANQAPLDLLIRTGGETRISNFMLWQAAYAELYFCPEFWPDFSEQVFARAIESFAGVERRFGLISAQL